MADFNFTIDSNESILAKRIQDIIKRHEPTSTDMKIMAEKIGLLVSNQAKLNVTKQKLIDTGNLRSSIGYKTRRVRGGGVRITIGSFGVPYAAIHEFGFRGTVDVASFTRTITQAFGKRITPTVVTVRAHQKNMDIPARPYLRPAFNSTKRKVIDIIREMSVGA